MAESKSSSNGAAHSEHYAEGSFAARVQKQVEQARRNAMWRKEYMDWEMTLLNEREKGREEERANTARERQRADKAENEARQEKSRADQEKNRAEQEKNRAEQEKSRAEQEKSRADNLQAENERLKKLLAEHGIG